MAAFRSIKWKIVLVCISFVLFVISVLWFFTIRRVETDSPAVHMSRGTAAAVTVPLGRERLDGMLSDIDRTFEAVALISIVFAVFLGLRISNGITVPLFITSDWIRRISSGDADIKTHPLKLSSEFAELTHSLNTMAGELYSMLGELTEEKGLLEAILAKTDDGLIVTDNECRVRMLNPAAARLLGTSFCMVEGKTIIEGTLSEDLSQLVSRVLRTKIAASLEIAFASPNARHLNVYAAPIERPNEVFGAIVVMHDLSAARQIDSVRRDFIANVSHELRTPLASMRAMAETIMIRGRKDPDAAERFAGKIISEADRLTALSDDLLDLARIESGQSSLRAEVFSIGEITEQVVAEYILVGAQKGVSVDTDVANQMMVRADRDSVVQILMNLIDNAVKYTGSGGHVLVGAQLIGENVFVKITDTGIGIPSEDISRVFERFYRVDKARSRESGGTGLGLSIVKHLVEANGGRVTAESRPGEGTSFTFTLPSSGNGM